MRGRVAILRADVAKVREALSFPEPDEEKGSTNSPVDDTSLDERGALRDNAGDGYLRDPEMSSTTDPEGFAAGSDEGLDMGPPGEDGSAPTGSLEFPIENGAEDRKSVVWGQSVYGRVVQGGRGVSKINKKKATKLTVTY